MRTDIEGSILPTFEAQEGFRSLLYVEYHRARHVTAPGDKNDTYEASFAQTPGIQDVPIPQDSKMVDGMMMSVYIHGGVLKLGTDFSNVVAPIYGGSTMAAKSYSRPTIIDGDADYLYVFYQDSNDVIKRAKVAKWALKEGLASCVKGNDTIMSWSQTIALHAVALNAIYGLWIDDGGIRVSKIYLDGAWTSSNSTSRIMHHTSVYSHASSADVIYLNYSAAARFGNRDFIYQTYVDGNVMGVYYDNDVEAWSEVFEAVPQDLSIFAVANAFYYDDRLFLGGQFKRQDPRGAFTSPYIYNLLLQSYNGKDFSLDRDTLFAYGDEDNNDDSAVRFFTGFTTSVDDGYGVGNPATVHSSFGAWGASKAKYAIIRSDPDGQITGAGRIQGNYDDGWNIVWQRQDLNVFEGIKYGDGVNIYVGTLLNDGSMEWMLLQECIYTGARNPMGVSKTNTTAQFAPWSSGRLEDITHPLYIEIQGKQSIRDDLDEFDNLYRASEEGYLAGPFSVDFWSEGTVNKVEQAAGNVTTFETGDLKSYLDLVSYPVVGELPMTIKVYGWSRSGGDTNLSTGGGTIPANANAENVVVTAALVRDEGDDEESVIVVTDTSGSSGNHFPRTWYTSGSGSYPVELELTAASGIAVGDSIKRIKVNFTNPNPTSKTFSLIERVDIPELSAHYRTYDETWEAVPASAVDKTVVIRTNRGVFYTDDFGVTDPAWVDFNDGLGAEKNNITWMTYDSSGRNWLCTTSSSGSAGGVWRATSLGGTWTLLHSNDTAISKIDAANMDADVCEPWPVGGEGSNYRGIEAYSGVVVAFGGGTSSGNCNHQRTVFVSWDGGITLEPKKKTDTIHPTTHLIQEGGRFIRTDGGRIIAGVNCAWGVGADSNAIWSDNDGASWEQNAGANIGPWAANIAIPFKGPEGRICYRPVASKDVNVGQTNGDHDNNDSIVTDWFPTNPGWWDYGDLGQSVATTKDQPYKIAMITDNSIYWAGSFSDNVDGYPVPDAWNQSTLFGGGKGIAIYPSVVDRNTWITGHIGSGVDPSIRVTKNDGTTWIDKTGDLRTVAGSSAVWVAQVVQTFGGTSDTDLVDDGQRLNRIGVPVIYFSSRPYYTINAQVAGKYRVVGDNCYGGVLVCGHDGKNYIAARASINVIDLIKVREGVETELASVAHTWQGDGWVQLTLHDGVFTVHVKDTSYSTDWGDALLTYSWQETDGALLLDKDISHVGVYALRDTPWFRICGFDPALGGGLGAMPIAQHWENFPSAGKIKIEDLFYIYTGKHTPSGIVEGPFQGRNVSGPYSYKEAGHNFSGYAAEVAKYENPPQATAWDDYNSYYFACDMGFAWSISGVDYSVGITTHGVPIPLRGRCRIFSPQAWGNVVGMSTRTWLTHALTGVRLEDGEDTTHQAGTIASLVSEGEVILYEFCASSGHEPYVDKDLIEKICGFASARAGFPSDKTYTSITLSGSEYQVS